MNISDLVGMIAEDYGWEVNRYVEGTRRSKIILSKGPVHNTTPIRKIWFQNDKVFICESKKCDHSHDHEVSIHDPKFEEIVRSWFPFFDERVNTALSSSPVRTPASQAGNAGFESR